MLEGGEKMRSALETLEGGKPPSIETPKEEEKLKKILSILNELDRCIVRKPSFSETKREFLRFGRTLAKAYRNYLASLRQATEERGSKWVGHLEFPAQFLGPDGRSWEGKAMVEIGEEEIKFVTKCSDERREGREKLIELGGELSPEGKLLRTAWWKEEISFGSPFGGKQVALLREIGVNFGNDNKIARVEATRNFHPSRETRPARAFVKYEIRLGG